MDAAAESGNLEIVQWLHEHKTDGCTTKAMDWAAMNNHLSVVQWLHAHRLKGCTTEAMDWALQNENLELILWFHYNRKVVHHRVWIVWLGMGNSKSSGGCMKTDMKD